jgi:hypothetical protein
MRLESTMHGGMANKRIEIRLRPEQEAAVEAWRNRQPGKPPRAFAIVMLMDIGLRAEGESKPRKPGKKK